MRSEEKPVPLPARQQRLDRLDAAERVDIHCHCLPGLDDGPADLDEAIDLCRALAGDGITTAIATPHQLGRFDGTVKASDIRAAVQSLNAALVDRGISLEIHPGADVRVDERIDALLAAGRVLTLADTGRFLLLELPHGTFIDIQPLVVNLVRRGVTPVLSHPERHPFLARGPQAAARWLDAGAVAQVTAGSLVGDFGPMAMEAAWAWLRSGAAALVATDAHDTASRRPRMSAALEAVFHRLGPTAAERVCVVNPTRVLAGRAIAPLAGLPRGA